MALQKKITQYVVGHKSCQLPNWPNLQAIQVGSGPDLNWLRDNVGDNIAHKNKNWCELTALYWIWKNDSHSDVIGFNHYRRYFKYLDQPEKIEDLLSRYDILVPKKEPMKESAWLQYVTYCGFEKDLKIVREVILEHYPQDVGAFDQVMASGSLSFYNMVITRKEILNEYCAWLFTILEEVELRCDLTGYTDYQARIFGFISERLLNVFLEARQLKVGYLSVLQTEQTSQEKTRMVIRRLRNKFEYSLKAQKYKKQLEALYEQN